MRYLVLTGHEPFWPETKELEKHSVYLGSWCFSANTKVKYEEQRNFDIIESPYHNWSDINGANHYTSQLSEKIITSMVPKLNEAVNLNLSDLFWQRYLIPKVLHVTQMLYDRYLTLKQIQKSEKQFLIRIVDLEKYTEFNNWDSEFYTPSLFFHEGNLFVLSHMLKEIKEFSKFTLSEHSEDEAFFKRAGFIFKTSERKLIKNYADEMIDFLVNYSEELYLGSIAGVSRFNKLYFYQLIFGWRSLIKKFFINLCNLKKFISYKETFLNLKNQRIGLVCNSEFEDYIDKYMLNYLHIPSKESIEKAMTFTSQFWIGKDIYSHDKIFIAAGAEHKSKWISAQHGGGYGNFLSFPIGQIEYKTANGFLSWGWDFNHCYKTYNIIPQSSPLLSQIKKEKIQDENQQTKILLVATSIPCYLYRFHSALLPDTHLDYIENRLLFLKYLERKAFQNLYYRPYSSDYGKGETTIVDHHVLNKDTKIYRKPENIFKNYDLIVVDHLATSNLITFAWNIPTIIFFSRDHFEYCNESKPYFDLLLEAGILFHDPLKAAEKINEIYDNPLRWWHTPEVQNAKNTFSEKFARSNKNWKQEWVEYLRELVSK